MRLPRPRRCARFLRTHLKLRHLRLLITFPFWRDSLRRRLGKMAPSSAGVTSACDGAAEDDLDHQSANLCQYRTRRAPVQSPPLISANLAGAQLARIQADRNLAVDSILGSLMVQRTGLAEACSPRSRAVAVAVGHSGITTRGGYPLRRGRDTGCL